MAAVSNSTCTQQAELQLAEFGPVSTHGTNERTPMGANLVPGGATFRVWAPEALEVHIRLARTGDVICRAGDCFPPTEETRLHRGNDGRFVGFVPGVREGDHYRFYLIQRSQPYKRDPYARELEFYDWPNVDCILRNPASYPWHDAEFRTPRYNDAVIYQFHFGTFYDSFGSDDRPWRVCKFLDALDRIPHLAELGVNFVQPLPVVEFRTQRSLGYNGTDLFSPEMDYGVEPRDIEPYLARINQLLSDRGKPLLELGDLLPQANQLKAFVDLCHVYGIGVLFDVVYNHAGGFYGDDQNLFFYDRDPVADLNENLYFTDQGWAGGLVFAYWKKEVRQFLIDNANYFIREYHVDGFRYDEVSVIDDHGGWEFCQSVTRSVKLLKPEALQIAEYWKGDQSYAVRRVEEGGAGFDAVLHPGIRGAVRTVIEQSAHGRDARVNLDSIPDALLRPAGYSFAWQTVQHLENHDRQRVQNDRDRELRIAALADPSDHRSWYARSRARVANGLLLTAPGIPMLFMGQEFLEDKFWTDDPEHHPGNLVWWEGLKHDRAMQDHLRFMRELVALRHRQPALRGESINVYYTHNVNRILAFHRWIENEGRDVVVVASLNESTFYQYDLGFPQPDRWLEVFNSDVYDNYVNPQVAGNAGAIIASKNPRDGLPASATIVIPANSILVFARD